MSITQQIDHAQRACHELARLGCRVLSVYISRSLDRPRIHIDTAATDALSAQRLNTANPQLHEVGLTLHGCDVFWFLEAAQERAA